MNVFVDGDLIGRLIKYCIRMRNVLKLGFFYIDCQVG